MLTQAQINQVAYNDNAIKNYKRNKAININKQKKEQERILKLRKQLQEEAKQRIKKTILLYDRTEVFEITDEQIDEQIAFWFDNYISKE